MGGEAQEWKMREENAGMENQRLFDSFGKTEEDLLWRAKYDVKA